MGEVQRELEAPAHRGRLSLVIRPAKESEDGFVYTGWRASFEKESSINRYSRRVYQRMMGDYMRAIRAEPGAETLVAADPEDDDNLLGFAVLNGDTLHYLYVKPTMWKVGVVPAMLANREIRFTTTRTRMGDARLKPEARGWELRPRFTL